MLCSAREAEQKWASEICLFFHGVRGKRGNGSQELQQGFIRYTVSCPPLLIRRLLASKVFQLEKSRHLGAPARICEPFLCLNRSAGCTVSFRVRGSSSHRPRYLDHIEADGCGLYRLACERNLDGIVGKLRRGLYDTLRVLKDQGHDYTIKRTAD